MTSTGSADAPATCLGCGCACDDIHPSVDGGRIVTARNACPLGAAWFGDGMVPTRVRAGGRDASLAEAIAAAAALLDGASRALIYLAPDVSCETQREAVALADQLRAAIDSVTTTTAMASLLAAQELGRATATLGEIRNRADVLVFWGVDLAVRYPRYWSRYAPAPAGVHVPDGRTSRTVVAVDIGDGRGPDEADVRIALEPADEVAALTLLAAMARGSDVEFEGPAAAVAAGLMTVARAGRYVVLVADAEPQSSAQAGDPGRAAALITATQALNSTTRAALSPLRAGGNRSGADACLTAHTGYPAAVDFSQGYPRYRPYDAARNLQQVDAVLVVGNAGAIPLPVSERLRAVPHAVVGPRASESALAGGAAVIDTGVAGIHESGTVFRMDDVPLPAPAVLPGPPAAAGLIRDLRVRVRAGAARSVRS